MLCSSATKKDEMVLSSFRHHIEDLVRSHISADGTISDSDLDEIVDFTLPSYKNVI